MHPIQNTQNNFEKEVDDLSQQRSGCIPHYTKQVDVVLV
jgi:hypothetical protein